MFCFFRNAIWDGIKRNADAGGTLDFWGVSAEAGYSTRETAFLTVALGFLQGYYRNSAHQILTRAQDVLHLGFCRVTTETIEPLTFDKKTNSCTWSFEDTETAQSAFNFECLVVFLDLRNLCWRMSY